MRAQTELSIGKNAVVRSLITRVTREPRAAMTRAAAVRAEVARAVTPVATWLDDRAQTLEGTTLFRGDGVTFEVTVARRDFDPRPLDARKNPDPTALQTLTYVSLASFEGSLDQTANRTPQNHVIVGFIVDKATGIVEMPGVTTGGITTVTSSPPYVSVQRKIGDTTPPPNPIEITGELLGALRFAKLVS